VVQGRFALFFERSWPTSTVDLWKEMNNEFPHQTELVARGLPNFQKRLVSREHEHRRLSWTRFHQRYSTKKTGARAPHNHMQSTSICTFCFQVSALSSRFRSRPSSLKLTSDFRISWATNPSVVVEASTALASPVWSVVSTNTLVDGWTYFSDAEWTNYPARFCRVRQW
jgi:hypothetical protein